MKEDELKKHLERKIAVRKTYDEDKIPFNFDLQAVPNTPKESVAQISYERKLAQQFKINNLSNQNVRCYI